jgi:hypothetical protein
VTGSDNDFLIHFNRGRYDVGYFSREMLGVDFNPAQDRWSELVKPIEGYRWKYKQVVHVAANQIGKTLGLAIMLIHAANYKIGIDPKDWDYLFTIPWKWYHLAPKQGIADLTRQDMVNLLKGQHPAQYDKVTQERRPGYRWQEALADVDIKFDKYYPGVKFWNGSEIHFRTTEDKAVAIQGVRANGVSMDECATEQHLLHILRGTIKMRVIAAGGPVWMVSTPDGINDYYEVVESIRTIGHHTFHDRVWEAPLARKALLWSHLTDNIGYGVDQEDLDYAEAESDPMKEQTLRGAFLAPLEAFFVPSTQILKAWVKGIPSEDRPRNGHKYVIFWDPSVSTDPTVVHIIDVTRDPWRGVYFRRWEKPMPVRQLIPTIISLHRTWNTIGLGAGFGPRAVTGFDATSMGGVMIKQDLAKLSPLRPLNFAGKNTKMNALTNLRSALSNRRLILPADWIQTQREVLNYRLDDKKLVQDTVMSLAGAAQIAAQGFSGAQRRRFSPGYRV